MELIFITEVNGRGRLYHKLGLLMEDFMKDGRDVMKVVFENYKSAYVAYICMYQAAQRSGHAIKVRKRKDEIYLVKQ